LATKASQNFIAVSVIYCIALACVITLSSSGAYAADTSKTKVVIQRRGDGIVKQERHYRETRDGRGERHSSPEEFRQQMKAELAQIPTLNKHMDRLMDIQSERYRLQSQRRSVASEQREDRGAIVKQFHELLRRDMELSEESRKVVQQIIKDMKTIQKELDARQAVLQKQIEATNTSTDDSSTSSTEVRAFRRSQRYLDFLRKKLRDLESHPDRLDLLSRMLRGIPFDDSPLASDSTAASMTPEQRLGELKMKRWHIQRQLRQVEDDIHALESKGIKAPDHNRDE